MSDCPDMSSYMNRCHSCRVERGCFMVYDRTDYMSMMGMRDCIRSCRMIPMYRGNYRMRIYERENFGGMMHEMMDDCEHIMDRYQMSNYRMRIYERENFGGMMHEMMDDCE